MAYVYRYHWNTILEAAGIAGVEIHTLPSRGTSARWQLQVMHGRSISTEKKGQLVISCMYPIRGPLQIKTKSDEVIRARRFIIGLC